MLARPNTGEHATAIEPGARIVQAEQAIRGVAAETQDAAVAARAQPRFVEEDDERLPLGSDRLPVLLRESELDRRVIASKPQISSFMSWKLYPRLIRFSRCNSVLSYNYTQVNPKQRWTFK